MAAGLTPPNGATAQNPNPVIRMEYCGMTELQLNYFRLKSSSGAIVATMLTSGDYWAELIPDQALDSGATYTVEADGRINDSGTLKAIAAGTWAFTVGTPSTDYIYHRNFEDTGFSIPHTFNNSEALSYLGAIGTAHGAAEGNVNVVADPSAGGTHGTVLKIDYHPGFYGFDDTGCQIICPFNSVSEAYMAWDIYIPNDFIYPNYQKLMNLTNDEWSGSSTAVQMAQLPNIIGNNPTARSIAQQYEVGWCSSCQDGEIMLYEYDGVPTNRRNINLGVTFQKGVWNKIEHRIKVNSSTSTADGIDQLWLDHQLVYSNTSRLWWGPNSNNQYINWLMYIFYVGGVGLGYAHSKSQSVYIDNVIVSATPITH